MLSSLCSYNIGIYTTNKKEPIGFCITSLEVALEKLNQYILSIAIGEINLVEKLLQNALAWMEKQKAIE